MRRFYELGVTELNGHLLYALPDGEYAAADAWLERHGISDAGRRGRRVAGGRATEAFDRRPLRQGRVRSSSTPGRTTPGWRPTAKPWPKLLEFREQRRRTGRMSAADWRQFAERASLYAAREKAQRVGRRRRVGLRAGEDPGGLLPGARRHPVRDRQIACGGAVCRHALDGDEDRRSR